MIVDKFGQPLNVGDVIIYTTSEKNYNMYTGTILSINEDKNICEILTEKTKRKITRIPNIIVSLNTIKEKYPENFI